MKLKILVLFICCLYSCTAYAQKTFTVKGLLIDTVSNTKIDKAKIKVLNAKDSVLQSSVYSTNGNFEVTNFKPGEFLLTVTYRDYVDVVAHFVLDKAQPIYNFGNVKMIPKARLLQEVIIKSKAVAMKIMGDTTEFNATAYATQKNAKVDELLKQFNGMKINQKGEILFLGEKVSKILIDGKEFFGDDPTLVSKTIRADMVNQLQVYDQKSETAKLSGIDDGVKVKTINIVLLEDKRKGIFGKLDATLGTEGYHQAEANFSKFNLKQKFSVFGGLGNTGKVGSSKEDFSEYGAPGIPFAREAGAHYDTKWNKDKQSVNLNYLLDALKVDQESTNLTQNNLPGNFNISKQDKNSQSDRLMQSLSAAFTSKIDPTADLRLNISSQNSSYTKEDNSIGRTTRGNGVLQNSSEIASTDDNESKNVYASAKFTKQFKKKGRSLSVNASSRFGSTKGNNYLRSSLNYYDNRGKLDSASKVDQYKPNQLHNTSITTGFSYADVVSKTLTLTTGYSFSRTEDHNDQRSYNRFSSTGYNELDSAFSSDFKLISVSGTYAVNAVYTAGKISANAGTSVADVGFKQTDLFSGVVLNRKFINWAPSASLRYQLNKAASLSFSYSGNTQQPRANQLQQLRQNADPLNITLGNSELRPSFRNVFLYNYRLYQPTLDRGLTFVVIMLL